MLELIQKIKTYTEAGIILEHMELFDELDKIISNPYPPNRLFGDPCFDLDFRDYLESDGTQWEMYAKHQHFKDVLNHLGLLK